MRRRRDDRVNAFSLRQCGSGCGVPLATHRPPTPGHWQRSHPRSQLGCRLYFRRGAPFHPQKHRCRLRVRLDWWTLAGGSDERMEDEVKAAMHTQTNSLNTTGDNFFMVIINNCFGIGVDAAPTLNFNNARSKNPSKFSSRANPWGLDRDKSFARPTHYDGLLEVIGICTVLHMGQIYSGFCLGIRLTQAAHPFYVNGEQNRITVLSSQSRQLS
ncbi:Diacylglycerol kinase theta [Echinococcus multilocularis]|uniref:Diacylglycerol kinase theta n=1 Tax=Echinococcus multilocularis TaxID=6211 RepID=A0A068YG84_ECHMU|nr:Diacylglycerol kinase theta [Echinococcus multilocularis]